MNIRYKDTRYIIYDDGRVFSEYINGFLKYRIHKSGYHIVRLNGKDKYVHILVAETFIPNPNNLPQVNHRDGNKDNNHYTNLEWITCRGNIRHAYDNKLMYSREVIQISNNIIIQAFDNVRQASNMTGISYGHIYDVCYKQNNRKSAGGFTWKFKEDINV